MLILCICGCRELSKVCSKTFSPPNQDLGFLAVLHSVQKLMERDEPITADVHYASEHLYLRRLQH